MIEEIEHIQKEINSLPMLDDYTKKKLRELAESCAPRYSHDEIFTKIRPLNKKDFNEKEILNVLRKMRGTIFQHIGNHYAYVHFRYFDNYKNYRMLIKQDGTIELGRRAIEDKVMRIGEFEPIVDYIKRIFSESSKEAGTEEPIFPDDLSISIRKFDYSFLVTERIDDIKKYLNKEI